MYFSHCDILNVVFMYSNVVRTRGRNDDDSIRTNVNVMCFSCLKTSEVERFMAPRGVELSI